MSERKITLTKFLKSDDAQQYKSSTIRILGVYKNKMYTQSQWNNLAYRIENVNV